MLRAAWLIARKDVRLLASGGSGFVQPLVFGLLLLFVLSLAQGVGERTSPRTAATIFWLASIFCLVLSANASHGLEAHNATRAGLLLAPIPVQSIWLGKGLSILLMLLLAQLCFFPASIAFLRQHFFGSWAWTGGSILLIDLGLAGLASLLGALAQGGSAKESLISLLLFPLSIPVLLAGINFGELAFSPGLAPDGVWDWLGLIAAFDAIFLATGLLLFPFIYTDED